MLPPLGNRRSQASSRCCKRLVAGLSGGRRAPTSSPSFLYDAAAGRYLTRRSRWAFPEESLLDSTADMQAQLGRYPPRRRRPGQGARRAHGPPVRRQRLAHRHAAARWWPRNAATEIDSTYVPPPTTSSPRSALPLPRRGRADGPRLPELLRPRRRAQPRPADPAPRRQGPRRRRRGRAPAACRRGRAAGAGASWPGPSTPPWRARAGFTALLTEAPSGPAPIRRLRRRLSIALADLLLASGLDAAGRVRAGAEAGAAWSWSPGATRPAEAARRWSTCPTTPRSGRAALSRAPSRPRWPRPSLHPADTIALWPVPRAGRLPGRAEPRPAGPPSARAPHHRGPACARAAPTSSGAP